MNRACEHWESTSPMFSGHCSHASCWNYMDSCPVHENYGYPPPARFGVAAADDRSGKTCTLEVQR